MTERRRNVVSTPPEDGRSIKTVREYQTWRSHLDPKMVLQSDAREEPFLFHTEPFKPGFSKEPFLQRTLRFLKLKHGSPVADGSS